ncbi:MAG: hypothetical protein M1830_002224, partial [Pleopsidium flavum]
TAAELLRRHVRGFEVDGEDLVPVRYTDVVSRGRLALVHALFFSFWFWRERAAKTRPGGGEGGWIGSYSVNILIPHILHFPSPIDARAIQQDVRLDAGGPDARKGVAQARRVRDVALENSKRAAAELLHGGRQRRAVWVLGHLDGDDVGAGFGEGDGHGQSESARAAGDERRSVGEGEEGGDGGWGGRRRRLRHVRLGLVLVLVLVLVVVLYVVVVCGLWFVVEALAPRAVGMYLSYMSKDVLFTCERNYQQGVSGHFRRGF